jgi:hypothetical protein
MARFIGQTGETQRIDAALYARQIALPFAPVDL